MTRVLITYPHTTSVGHNFHLSLMRTVREHAPIIEDILSMRCYPGDSLIQGRNTAVRAWLDDFKADYLWTLDTDIGFHPNTLPTLLEHDAPVVSGLYRTVYEDGWDQTGGPACWRVIPAAYRWTDMGAAPIEQGIEGVVKVGATGAGCMLIRRDTAEAMREKYGDEWFTVVRPYGDTVTIGEDFSFCWRLKELGIPLLCDATVMTTHHKAVWV